MVTPSFRARAALAAALSCVSIGAVGCGGDAEDERYARLAARAEEVRELSFVREVPVQAIPRYQFLALAGADSATTDDADLQQLAATYGRLGFFPLDADLRAILGDSSNWVGALYDPEAEAILLVGDVPDSTIVHEFVHALQDQHFDLDAISEEHETTSDAFLGVRASVEGDAVLAEARFTLQDRYGVDLDHIDWAKAFEGTRSGSENLLAGGEVPPMFLAYPSFVYSYGFAYCAHNLTGVTFASPEATKAFPYDWSQQDALFSEDLPRTTQQVTAFDADDEVVAVGLDDVPAALAGRLELETEGDVLGEWYSYLLLYPFDGATGVGDVRALAAAWDGDRVLFVRDLETDAVGVAWASAWDDADAAARVEAALWALYGAAVVDPLEPRAGEAADGEAVWIERREERVVVSKNVDPTIAAELAAAAFPAAAEPMRLARPAGASLAAKLARRLRFPR